MQRILVMETRLNSADTRAGVLIGLTTAVFGLVATAGGSGASLFMRQAYATPAAIGLLALGFFFLVSSFFTAQPLDFPEPTVFIALANQQPEQVKEVSLQAMGVTLEFNRVILGKKVRRIFLGEVMLALFVALVVLFEGIDLWPKVAGALAAGQSALPHGSVASLPTPTPVGGASGPKR